MRIKVGHLDYEVLGLDGALANVGDLFGYCQHHPPAIYIAKNQAVGDQASTLLHELMHACFTVFDLPRTGLDEETVCRKLEGPLSMVFRDNPELLGVLHQALSKGKAIV